MSGLALVWVTIAAFLVLAGTPEITAVIVDNVLNEAVPSRHRASLLSMIAFVESVLIGTGYLVLGALMDGLGSPVSAWPPTQRFPCCPVSCGSRCTSEGRG